MELAIKLCEDNSLSEVECNEIDIEIDRIINKHKNNRQMVNKMVFESVVALTESENYANELNSQGTIKRFFCGITGKNRQMQNNIDTSLARAQYASQQTLQKLAEQNLMSFELITSINNKLNSSLIKIESEINNIYGVLVTFFKQTKSDLVQLENRVDKLERNVKLLNWQNSIEFQVWNGIEYSELDDISKIVCVVRDFCDLTNFQGELSDFLLLKVALKEIKLSSETKINYLDFISEVYNRINLREKLFGDLYEEIQLEPTQLSISTGIKKMEIFEFDERYILDGVVGILEKKGVSADLLDIKENMFKNYFQSQAKFQIDNEVNIYEFIVELIYNLEMLHMQYNVNKETECIEEVEDEGTLSELDDVQNTILPEELFKGDYIEIGTITNKLETKRLHWQILDIFDDSILVLLCKDDQIYDEKCYDKKYFSFDYCNSTDKWKKCYMREYLNRQFYNSVFDENEKKFIVSTYLEDVDCEDKVFNLSYNEAKEYEYLIVRDSTSGGFWTRNSNDWRSDSLWATRVTYFKGKFDDPQFKHQEVQYTYMLRPAILIKKNLAK